jgi:DNA-binding FrmR family transcriptional regulator
LKKANYEIIEAHLEHCVKNAKGEAEIDNKLAEISAILKRMSS